MAVQCKELFGGVALKNHALFISKFKKHIENIYVANNNN